MTRMWRFDVTVNLKTHQSGHIVSEMWVTDLGIYRAGVQARTKGYSADGSDFTFTIELYEFWSTLYSNFLRSKYTFSKYVCTEPHFLYKTRPIRSNTKQHRFVK